MLMVEDGILCTIHKAPGQLQKLQEDMSPTDLHKCKRRYRKAWRTADKKKELRSGPKLKLLERSIRVNKYYINKAKQLIDDK